MYSIQLQVAALSLSFSRMFHVRNIVPDDSDMAVACRAGDFDLADRLLRSGLAYGSVVTASGWTMLDVSVQPSVYLEPAIVLTPV